MSNQAETIAADIADSVREALAIDGDSGDIIEIIREGIVDSVFSSGLRDDMQDEILLGLAEQLKMWGNP